MSRGAIGLDQRQCITFTRGTEPPHERPLWLGRLRSFMPPRRPEACSPGRHGSETGERTGPSAILPILCKGTLHQKLGGGGGIRTHEALRPTRSPGVPNQPLLHPSEHIKYTRAVLRTQAGTSRSIASFRRRSACPNASCIPWRIKSSLTGASGGASGSS